MSRFNHMIWVCLLIASMAFAQSSRESDSLRELLFKKGLIPRSYYKDYKPDKIAIRDRIKELRRHSKYKFFLDFLLEHSFDSSRVEDPEEIPLEPEKQHSDDILEQLLMGGFNSLYQVRSVQGDKQYYLIAYSVGKDPPESPTYFDLMRGSSPWDSLDSFDLGGKGAKFDFEKVNNLNFIKVVRLNFGSPYYSEDEALLEIVDDKFRVAFWTRRLELYTPEGRDPVRTLSTIKFVDLDGDGFMDILEETRKEELDRSEFDKCKEGEEMSLNGKKLISKRIEKYRWDNASCAFVKMN